MAYFRQKGIRIVIYMDDMLIIAPTWSEAYQQANFVKSVLKDLGFVISDKSMANPSTTAPFLGVQIDSIAMTVALPEDKVLKINQLAQSMLGELLKYSYKYLNMVYTN